MWVFGESWARQPFSSHCQQFFLNANQVPSALDLKSSGEIPQEIDALGGGGWKVRDGTLPTVLPMGNEALGSLGQH